MPDGPEQHLSEPQCLKDQPETPDTSSAVVEGASTEKEPCDIEQGRKQEGALLETPYSAFTEREKKATILLVSWLALVSPLSASIYFPALDDIASSLHVSIAQINLTITTYQVSKPRDISLHCTVNY